MYSQINEFSFKGKNIYVGIDVHLKSWTATVLSDSLTLKTFRLDSSPEALCTYLFRSYPGANFYSVYEAGFSGYATHRALLRMGINNIVVNPADVPTTGKDKLRKTDAADSAKLAISLRAGQLKPIYIPEEDAQELRSLARLQATITKDQTRIKNRIKGYLRFLGIAIPAPFSGTACWSHAFIDWLRSVSTATPNGKYVLDVYIAQLEEIRQRRLELLRLMRRISKEAPLNAQIELLKSVPGIGDITAMRLLAEIIDINRFKDVNHFAAFIGIVPMCHKSGDDSRDDNGSITSRANRMLRCALIESAWTAVGLDPVLTRSFEDLAKRMKRTSAIVRIARKLVNRIYFVLKHQCPYVTCTN